MTARVLLGDEAVGLAALHAGISAAYAYPGTPSTEILEFIQRNRPAENFTASWSANEKTAYEQALGVSMAGGRVLVAMKHVGLNVAADPFVNSALVDVKGGVVLAVADDPGMHSSQNEQDSRILSDFARVVCLEPRNQQEAYDMTREAFDLSERFAIPIVLRLVTRLAHSRAVVHVAEPVHRPPQAAADRRDWILLPANARRRWRALLARQALLGAYTEAAPHNSLRLAGTRLGVITAGVGRNYFAENAPDLSEQPSHLHIGAYPLPVVRLRELAAHTRRILVLEDGYPMIERAVRGLLPQPVEVLGRESGSLPPDGELTPDTVRIALGLSSRHGQSSPMPVPERPPQLCAGCPHLDTFAALQRAREGLPRGVVASDIGCYTLGALPPVSGIDSCVCMGASIGMAKGASDAGVRPSVAVIGDSTFLHSGITPLIDAVAANADLTLIILDNEVVAMTGAQPTILPSSRLQPLILGLGVDPAHCRVIDAHPRHADANAATIRAELEHPGLSVIVAVRECVEAARARKAARRKGAAA